MALLLLRVMPSQFPLHKASAHFLPGHPRLVPHDLQCGVVPQWSKWSCHALLSQGQGVLSPILPLVFSALQAPPRPSRPPPTCLLLKALCTSLMGPPVCAAVFPSPVHKSALSVRGEGWP
ncbi:hypothetical protein P7K49_003055 [Saguinus oedipus]|uniref:Uncharacterized protein n=1 Tax=Saguinus oedipus TaxID=9490 RepID=A0ABQ9WJ30_SAGOE|nr:hypothetical protein P7K49_003055 [Saguinus oedipus]